MVLVVVIGWVDGNARRFLSEGDVGVGESCGGYGLG